MLSGSRLSREMNWNSSVGRGVLPFLRRGVPAGESVRSMNGEAGNAAGREGPSDEKSVVGFASGVLTYDPNRWVGLGRRDLARGVEGMSISGNVADDELLAMGLWKVCVAGRETEMAERGNRQT